jgi:hypothetical protein
LTSVERLEIYARAYYARLLECMRAEFPMLAKAMGEELFDEFAVDYLRRHPSRSYTLCELGAKFAQFLSETRPAPGQGELEVQWPDFLIDLARLEWTFNEVFDGPGVEHEKLLDQEQLQAIPGDRWPDVRLVAAPCLRLLELGSPVHRYYRALRDQDDAAPPDPAPTWLAVTRRDFICRHYELTEPQFNLLGSLMAGGTIQEAVVKAACGIPEADFNRFAADLQDWFRRWSAEGFFLRAELGAGQAAAEDG